MSGTAPSAALVTRLRLTASAGTDLVVQGRFEMNSSRFVGGLSVVNGGDYDSRLQAVDPELLEMRYAEQQARLELEALIADGCMNSE